MKTYYWDWNDVHKSEKDYLYPGQWLGFALPEEQPLPEINEEVILLDEDGESYQGWVYGLEDRGRGVLISLRMEDEPRELWSNQLPLEARWEI